MTTLNYNLSEYNFYFSNKDKAVELVEKKRGWHTLRIKATGEIKKVNGNKNALDYVQLVEAASNKDEDEYQEEINRLQEENDRLYEELKDCKETINALRAQLKDKEVVETDNQFLDRITTEVSHEDELADEYQELEDTTNDMLASGVDIDELECLKEDLIDLVHSTRNYPYIHKASQVLLARVQNEINILEDKEGDY